VKLLLTDEPRLLLLSSWPIERAWLRRSARRMKLWRRRKRRRGRRESLLNRIRIGRRRLIKG
jgi:hypothetical protein